MVAYLFATEAEAAHSLEQSAAVALQKDLYAWNGGYFLITGMGLEQTRETLTAHIERFDYLLNFGIAGALKGGLTDDVLYEVKTVAHEGVRLSLASGTHSLFSVKQPLHDPGRRDELSLEHDLVDMEGYVIAELAKERSKACRLFKLVSDRCDNDTSVHIRERLPVLSQLLWHHIQLIKSEMTKVIATGSLT